MARQRKIKRYNYGSLSMRRRRGRWLKVLLFILLLGGLTFLGYCVAKSLGDLQNRPEPESSLPESSLVSEIVPPDEPSSAPESSAPDAEEEEIRAVVMLAADAADPARAATFLASLDETLYNTVVVELKSSDGALAYQSAVPLAATCGAISSSAMTMDELESLAAAIEEAGFTPAAWLYTLEDDVASHATYETSYLYENQTGVTWLDQAADQGGRSWLNPYMPAAREYLSAIAGEVAEAGFAQIFAAGLQYPDTRYPQQMGYGPYQDTMTLTEALQAALDEMVSAAARYDAEVIPVYAGEGYLGEADDLYGGSPAAITAEKVSVILPEGRESAVLAAIPDTEALIPVVGESQLAALETADIRQYLVQ